jgi:hypothetical protein
VGGDGCPNLPPHHGTERSLPKSHDGGCGCGCGYGFGRGPMTPGISIACTTAGSRGRRGPSLGTPRDIAPAGSRAKSHDSRRPSCCHPGGMPTARMTPDPSARRHPGRREEEPADCRTPLETNGETPVGTSRLPGRRPSLPDSTRIAQTPASSPRTIRPPNGSAGTDPTSSHVIWLLNLASTPRGPDTSPDGMRFRRQSRDAKARGAPSSLALWESSAPLPSTAYAVPLPHLESAHLGARAVTRTQPGGPSRQAPGPARSTQSTPSRSGAAMD